MSERGTRSRRYPYDLQEVQIPAHAMEIARRETYRLIHNMWTWQGDLNYLCALCYLQGVLDGAQVARNAAPEPPPERETR